MRTVLTETETAMFVVVVEREESLRKFAVEYWRDGGRRLPLFGTSVDCSLGALTIRPGSLRAPLVSSSSGRPHSQQTPRRVSRLRPRPRPPSADS
jgi:hypothetical protein